MNFIKPIALAGTIIMLMFAGGCDRSDGENGKEEQAARHELDIKHAEEAKRALEVKRAEELRQKQHAAAQSVVDRFSDLSKTVNDDVHAERKTMPAALAWMHERMQEVDFTDCPQDFKEAAVDYISAINVCAVEAGQLPTGFWQALDLAAADTLNGRASDHTLNERKGRVVDAFTRLEAAKVALQKIGMRYDCK